MTLNDQGEVVWEPPAKCVTDMYRTAIYQHIMANFDKTLSEPEQEEARVHLHSDAF